MKPQLSEAHRAATVCCLIASTLFTVHAAETPPAAARFQIKGILFSASKQVALIEGKRSGAWGSESFMLSPGERSGDLEVLGIDALAGKVQVRLPVEKSELSFAAPALPTAADGAGSRGPTPRLQLRGAGTEAGLALYQLLTGRTVLRENSLPAAGLDLLVAGPASDAELAEAVRSKLAESGIFVRPDGERFALAAAEEKHFERVTPQVKEIVSRLGDWEAAPIGALNFFGTDLGQVLKVYQALVGRTVVRPAALPLTSLVLQSQPSMSRAEAIYALNATLAINGISVQPAGDRFVMVFPTEMSNQANAVLSRVAKSHITTTNAASGTIDFPRASLSQLASMYAETCGRSVGIDASLPLPVLSISSPSTMKADEILFGLELLFGLNGLAVVPDGSGRGLTLVPESQAKQSN